MGCLVVCSIVDETFSLSTCLVQALQGVIEGVGDSQNFHGNLLPSIEMIFVLPLSMR